MAGPFQETNGDISMRRILAFIFACLSIPLAVLGILNAASGWVVFIPFLGCQVAVIFLLFFTTWADIKEIVQAIKGQ